MGQRFAVQNITGNPVSTVVAILVAAAQYVAGQGAQLPHDATGWVQFVAGLVFVVAGSLYGGKTPPAAAAAVLLCGLGFTVAVAACKVPTQPTPNPTPVPTATVDPTTQAAIDAGVQAAAGLGCMFIPPQDKIAAAAGLSAVSSAIAGGPAAVLSTLEQLASNPALAWLWSAFHAVIDQLNGISGQQWFAYMQGAVKSAIAGCQGALGATA